MHLFHRADSSHPDSHGRFHLTSDEMADRFTYFHNQLSATYWKSQANQKVCCDAMDTLRSTHISKKSPRFLSHFTALVREVYSHAHYNVQELLYDERQSVRDSYWTDIVALHEVIMRKAEHVWPHATEAKMTIQLQFASLYTLYKDVASQDFIVSIYQQSVDWMHDAQERQSTKEQDKMYDYFDQIQLSFRLRNEIRRGSTASMAPRPSVIKRPAPLLLLDKDDKFEADSPIVPIQMPVGVSTDHRKSRQATKDEMDDFFEHIMKQQRKEHRQQRRQRGDSLASNNSVKIIITAVPEAAVPAPQHPKSEQSENLEDDAPLPEPVVASPPKHHHAHIPYISEITNILRSRKEASHAPVPLPTTAAAEQPMKDIRKSVEEEPSSPEPLKRASVVFPRNSTEEPALDGELGVFDFKADWERRFNKRKEPPVGVELPVIPKPNPIDRVNSYRRKGLFNEVIGNRKSRDVSRLSTSESKQEDKISAPSSLAENQVEVSDAAEIQLSPPASDVNDNIDYFVQPVSAVPPPKPPRRLLEEKMVRAVIQESPISPMRLDADVS